MNLRALSTDFPCAVRSCLPGVSLSLLGTVLLSLGCSADVGGNGEPGTTSSVAPSQSGAQTDTSSMPNAGDSNAASNMPGTAGSNTSVNNTMGVSGVQDTTGAGNAPNIAPVANNDTSTSPADNGSGVNMPSPPSDMAQQDSTTSGAGGGPTEDPTQQPDLAAMGGGSPVVMPGEQIPEPTSDGSLGSGEYEGSGMSDDRYANDDVQRNGQNYRFIANGWGPGFQSQSVSWNGTSFVVENMQGSQGPNYQPASYPSMFCGQYSDSTSKECGLPAALDSLTSVKTGWRWNPNGNEGEYNAAYDIWIGSASGGFGGLKGYLMVWLREPPGQQPAGMKTTEGLTDIQGLSGTWDIWTGTVNNLPITNYVRQEGDDVQELEFDVMDVIADANARGIMLPGDRLLAVAIGFEIWNGPITNLATEDFYVNVE